MGGSNGSLRRCFNHEKILEDAVNNAQINIQCQKDNQGAQPCSTKVPKYFTKQFMIPHDSPFARLPNTNVNMIKRV